jgi:hypothetical protein
LVRSLFRFFRGRVPGRAVRVARIGGLFAGLGAFVALGKPAPAAHDIGDLARFLSDAVGGVVLPEDIRWEPSRGIFADWTSGRFVVFLAAEAKGAPRDVWRARVRVTPEGRGLEVVAAHDLTSTPLGDDHELVLSGTRAAFATHAFGQEQSITALDLSGEGALNLSEQPIDHVMSWTTNVQQTGSGQGIGRIDVTLDQPARKVALALSNAELSIDLEDATGEHHALLDFEGGVLRSPSSSAPLPSMHAEAARHLPKRFIFWAVDTVRAVPEIGPAPIAWLEEKVFAARDWAKQLAFKLHGDEPTSALLLTSAASDSGDGPDTKGLPPATILDASKASADSAQWPPPQIRTIWKTAEPGEGEWVAPRLPWIHGTNGANGAKKNAPAAPTGQGTAPAPQPAFMRTFVRPDEERPYSRVLLVAMDMRQLDLAMEAGVEDPKPLAGPHGNGRLPRDPQIATRVVAAFNGAFKTEHGNYGMMVNRRVLLPPVPGAASVVVLKDARVGLGTWGSSPEIGGIDGVAPGDILSFRQNLDPLVDHGEVNPTKRALWGYTLPGNGMQTERSGICVTDSGGGDAHAPRVGHLVYAWGDDVSATTLGKAMKMAGCAYGMHLDMNPHHTGFVFANITDLKGRNYKSELLSPLMEIPTDRYIEYAPKDFFYVLLHDPTPPSALGASAWRADGGTQPAPAWMPGVWTATAQKGAVELFEIDKGRATWRIRAGAKEPDSRAGSVPVRELSEEDAHRVLLAIGAGVAGAKRPRGLATDGRIVLAIGQNSAHDGVLVAEPEGALAIVRPNELGAIAPHADAAELPLVLDGGAVVPGGTAPPDGPTEERAALGITPDGRILLARAASGAFTSLAEALKSAGCTRAVALDRGIHAKAILHRAGTADPPRAFYDETTIYALATPLKPRGFRFEATGPVPAPQPHAIAQRK